MKALFFFLATVGFIMMTPSSSTAQFNSHSNGSKYTPGTDKVSGLDLGSGRFNLTGMDLGSGRLHLSGTGLGSGRFKTDPLSMNHSMECQSSVRTGARIVFHNGSYFMIRKGQWMHLNSNAATDDLWK